MKKLLFVFATLLFVACDDGDFDVPSFEFEETVAACGEYILYVKNSSSTETLAITLSASDVPTEAGIQELEISSQRSVNYRIYDEAIGTDYFCLDIPPIEPSVIKELYAEGGTIIITSTENSSGLDADISFSGLVFQDGQERIFFETFYFGSVQISF